MKINIWFVIACVLVFCVGYNMNDVAVSFPKYKVAVIDVAQVLENSNEIQELKRAQDKDMEELKKLAASIGIKNYQIGPLVRSSYNAASLV